MLQTPDPDLSPADLDQAHRVLLVICLALAGGVSIMAGVAFFLHSSGTYPPFLGFSDKVRWGVAIFLAGLLGASYPVHRAAGGSSPVRDSASALQAFQTRTIASMAIREFVGIAGAVLILLSGDLVVGGTMVVLAVVTILLALPRKDDLVQAVRRAE